MAEREGQGAVAEEERVVDLTSSQLHSLDDVDLPRGLVELDLTANRLANLDERLQYMSSLKKLSMRQNLLTDDAAQPLSHWPSLFGLQELVLRDNKLTMIPHLEGFASLEVLDVSFNEVTSLDGMSMVSSKLREFYASKNEIGRIEQLEHLSELRLLELGSNKIRAFRFLKG